MSKYLGFFDPAGMVCVSQSPLFLQRLLVESTDQRYAQG
jgi:hypothetical protein